MKAYLKKDPTRVGEVQDVYVVRETGQSRALVAMEYGTVDADVEDFELFPDIIVSKEMQ